MQCKCKTNDGYKCRRLVADGETYCWQHKKTTPRCNSIRRKSIHTRNPPKTKY